MWPDVTDLRCHTSQQEELPAATAVSASKESKSLLLLGEPGSGKTQAVDWCLQKLKEESRGLAEHPVWEDLGVHLMPLAIYCIFLGGDLYEMDRLVNG